MNRNTFQRYSTGILLGLGLLLAGVGGTAKTAYAQAAPKFGSVDMGQILNESKSRKVATDELTGTVTGLRTVLQRMQEVGARFLTEAEIRELAGLYEKKTPSDAEKKRISALEDSATLKAASKTRLENTAQPSEEQGKQYRELVQTEAGGNQVLKTISDDFTKRVNARENDLQTKQLAAIKAAIAKVAKEKDLAVVFDSQIAYYTSNDITADVIKEVNK